MINSISSEILAILSALEKAGHEAYIVGGFVRDILMNTHPHDADITTDAEPEEIKRIFSHHKTLDIGIKHGTVTVFIGSQPVEITTFRTESTYSDSRHPDSVCFTKSLSEDLARRDFTVCAIACSSKGEITDLYGGRRDIEGRVIRCVGEAERRFREDALRILRGLRFASVLGFTIEEETARAMRSCKGLLSKISKERIFEELSKLICGKNVRYILENFSDVLEAVIPEIKGMKGFEQKNPHHIYDILSHTAAVVESTPPLLHLRLAALFHDSGKPDTFSLDSEGVGHFYSHASVSSQKAKEALTRLRCDRETLTKVTELVRRHDAPIEENERAIKRKLRSIGEEMLSDLITLQRADTKGLAPEFHSRAAHFDALEKLVRDVISAESCFSLRSLAVNGKDMISLGLEGKEIGKALNLALEGVIEERVRNEREELIEFIKNSLL